MVLSGYRVPISPPLNHQSDFIIGQTQNADVAFLANGHRNSNWSRAHGFDLRKIELMEQYFGRVSSPFSAVLLSFALDQ